MFDEEIAGPGYASRVAEGLFFFKYIIHIHFVKSYKKKLRHLLERISQQPLSAFV